MRVSILAASAATALATVAPADAQTFRRFDKVEAQTAPDQPWRSCYVNAPLVGAYDVQCDDYVNYVVYDVRVRKPGGQPVAQTAAQTPVEGAWKAGDLVFVSPTAMFNSWKLCSYISPSGGGHEVTCAGRQPTVVGNDWIRIDPDFPVAAAAAEPAPEPADPSPEPAEPAVDPAAVPAPATTTVATYRRYDQVEAETQRGFPWESYFVDKAYPGAYDLSCQNAGKVIVRDTHVRRPGGQPVAASAAQPVAEGQYRFNDLVLASPTYMHNAWQLCAYVRPQGGGHAVMCGGQYGYVVSNDWIRVDPDAAQ